MRKINTNIVCMYVLAVGIGLVVGILYYPEADSIKKIEELQMESQLIRIFIQNGFVISLIYVVSIFAPLLGILIVFRNGYVLGITLAWIIKTELSLLLLILPHGIFEIPCFLFAGIIIKNGKCLFENMPLKFLKYWSIHILCVFLIALIEVYITPSVYSMLFS